MKQLIAKTTGSSEFEDVTITFRASGEAKEAVCKMLQMMAALGSVGASRMLGITDDPHMKDEKVHYGEDASETAYPYKEVFMDGDGSDKIRDIKVNGKDLW